MTPQGILLAYLRPLWQRFSMGFYNTYILPVLIEHACAADPVRVQRQNLVPRALGQVAEIGMGTGHNLPFYDPDKVSSVVGVDPAGDMLEKATQRAGQVAFPVEMAALSGENLPFEDASMDTVLVTYSLCSIPDPLQALLEMRRVLRPNGRLLFAEHGAAPDEAVARWQGRLERWFWPKIAGGCHLTRRPDQLITQAGFSLEHLDRLYLPKTPKTLGFNYIGSARPR
ncbi:phospholipid methyltransferase [Iodidimonas muriae]|uniref:Phospholipid methyltransferase n=1 Tax=Iodidimonas muriae TaxID=261467 RepID=A0ABQ2L6H5_9PROT|nr:class I SAM-dependent methyltransferase [Iodidimonas muriae]GGO05179.1 phospholipid methyltransferase [Iodidimonas muriae]